MNLVFFVPCIPPAGTAQHKGVRVIVPSNPSKKPFAHFFTKAEILAAERIWSHVLSPHRPAAPFLGPVALTLNFVYPWRKSELKGRIATFEKYPIEVAPDVENVAKLCIDVMQRIGFFKNDSQISALLLTKNYGDEPGIGVILTRASAVSRSGVKIAAE